MMMMVVMMMLQRQTLLHSSQTILGVRRLKTGFAQFGSTAGSSSSITGGGIAGTGVGILMLLLIVKLLLMLLRFGNKDDRGKAVLGLNAGIRLQTAILGRVGTRFSRVTTSLGLGIFGATTAAATVVAAAVGAAQSGGLITAAVAGWR